MMNILAYADKIALLAPSWAAMQELIVVLVAAPLILIWFAIQIKLSAWS
jgi:hypothetical protein